MQRQVFVAFLAVLCALNLACGDDGGKGSRDAGVPDGTDGGDTAIDDTVGVGDSSVQDSGQGDGGCATSPTLCPEEAPLCDATSGECVECLGQSDCGFFAPVCEAGACLPCSTNGECATSAYGALCDASAGVCVECLANSDCAAPSPVCNRYYGLCAGCESSFDCSDPAEPACVEDAEAGTITCGAFSECTGDDGREPGDDGPAGATQLALTGGTASVDDASICNAPAGEEADWYVFNVSAGENATFTVDWDDSAMDLDVSLFTADGTLLGESWYAKPEVVSLTFLPEGPVYAAVTRFDAEGVAQAGGYRVAVTVDSTGGCSAVSDCAASFATQLFRGQCAGDGACVWIEGGGAAADGASCDSSDDCASGVCGYGRSAVASDLFTVTAFYWAAYLADADAVGVCTSSCQGDSGCAAGVCTEVFGDEGNYCTAACSSSADCPVDLMAAPTSGPWAHLTCNAGHCEP